MHRNQVRAARRTTALLFPGLAFSAAASAICVVIHLAVESLSPLVAAVAFGAVIANSVGVPARFSIGIRFASRRLLRVGVALLGFQLSLAQVRALGGSGLAVVAVTVSITFLGTRWFARRLGLSDGLGLLVATGFSICGASAIAAVEGIADAEPDEVAFSIALVTLCGSLAIVVLPIVGHILGLGPIAYGNWVGASVHDIGQVVAAATPAGADAVRAAVVVKLTRVVLLAPLVAGLLVARRRTVVHSDIARPAVVPTFVVGFIVAILLGSSGLLSAEVLRIIKLIQTGLLTMAMFGLGCGVNIGRLRRLGGRPLVLGLVSWLLVAGVALAATRLLPT